MTNKLMIEVSRQQLEYWMVMLRNGLPETVSSMIQTVLEVPEAPRQEPTYYRVVTPRVVVNGEPTEWWPACILYTKKQLDALTEPYKIEERFYSAPLSPDHSGGGAGMSDLMKIAADLACRKPLNKLYQVCETQGRIGTVSLHEHLDTCGDLLAGMAIDIRRALDKVKELNQ